MKRAWITNILLVLICAAVIFGIFYLNDPEAFEIKRDDESKQEDVIRRIRYPVIKGEVQITESAEGRVIFGRSDIYIEMLEFETDKGSHQLKKGCEVKKGDVLYRIQEKNICADFSGKVVDITENAGNTLISLLNYDKLYAEVELDAEVLGEIGYDTKAIVEIGAQKCETKIKHIGYEIRNGKISVEVGVPERVLPGSDLKVTFIIDVRSDALYLPAEAVFEVNGRSYAMRELEDEKYERTEVEVGEYFEVKEGDNVFSYYQILSGLSEEDIVIIERMIEYADFEGVLK